MHSPLFRSLLIAGAMIGTGAFAMPSVPAKVINGCELKRGGRCDRVDLSNQDLSNLDLEGFIFSDVNLQNANFRNARLNLATIYRSNATGASFENAVLTSALLWNSNFSKAKFKGANLEKADFKASSADDADFANANLKNVNNLPAGARVATGNGKGQLVNGCRVGPGSICSNAGLSGLTLSAQDLSNSTFSTSDFRKSTFNKVNFAKGDFSGGTFAGAVLTDVDFRNANLSGVSFVGATIRNVDFRGANLEGADFLSVKADGNFEGANLQRMRMDHLARIAGNFKNADMRGAVLHSGYMPADVNGANFASALFATVGNFNMKGGKFERANMWGRVCAAPSVGRCDYPK
ncbi:MAG: pentapeptide repeat-containing protein [Burkholderiales bacterium]|nr:pentapeptide repeat-containing protein [Burkholderiales bacterium]